MSVSGKMKYVWILMLLHVLVPALAERVLICYYTNWAQYRQGVVAQYLPYHIDPFLCTHIVIAFAKIDPDADSLEPTEWNDLQRYAETVSLKFMNPDLKVLLAVGGYNHGPVPFNIVASSAERTDAFAVSAITLLREAGLDGLDIDWEWPDDTSSLQFISFIMRLRLAFERDALTTGKQRLILTVATSADLNSIFAYGPLAISRFVDYVLVMAYDQFDVWNPKLAHHSALYTRSEDINDPNLGVHSQNKSIHAWLNAGIPRDKLVLGLATYGRGVRLNTAQHHNIGDFYSRQLSSAGAYTKIAGVLAYYEICQKLSNGWTRQYVRESEVPLAWSSSSLDWTCYDDLESFTAKAKYIVDHKIAGAMIWSLDFDDFTSQGCNMGKYPLISQIKKVFDEAETSTNPPWDNTARAQYTTTQAKPILSGTNAIVSVGSANTMMQPSLTNLTTTSQPPTTTTLITPTTLPLTTTTATPSTTTDKSTTTRTTTTTKPSTTTKTTTTTKKPTTTTKKTTTTTMRTTATYVGIANAAGPTCPEAFSWYRDPTDCASYIRCVWFEARHFTCPSGLLFNTELLVCDWSWSVRCP